MKPNLRDKIEAKKVKVRKILKTKQSIHKRQKVIWQLGQLIGIVIEHSSTCPMMAHSLK